METMSAPFTRALYDRLPEGYPAQLVDGHLVHDPSPTCGHQALVMKLGMRLVEHVGIRRAFVAPVDVVLDDLNVVQPDVAVYETPPPLHERHDEIPIAVFEILSPSNRRLDREVKAGKYLAAGIREVWLIDPEKETVGVLTAVGGSIVRGADTARSVAVEGFTVVPDELFAVLREPPSAEQHP